MQCQKPLNCRPVGISFREFFSPVRKIREAIRPVGRRDRGQLGATWQQPIKQGVEMTDENPELEDIPIDRTEAFNNLGAAVAAFIDLGMRQLKPGAEAAVATGMMNDQLRLRLSINIDPFIAVAYVYPAAAGASPAGRAPRHRRRRRCAGWYRIWSGGGVGDPSLGVSHQKPIGVPWAGPKGAGGKTRTTTGLSGRVLLPPQH